MTHVCLNRIPRVIAAMGILAAGPALAGQIIYVDAAATGSRTGQSWESAFDNLQDALDRAVAGQEIWVAQGTYVPTARRDPANLRSASFALVNGVAVYGGFAGAEPARSQRNWVANRTVLSGDTFGDDGPNFTNITENTYHVVTAMGVESATVLDGVVITRGNATGAPGGDPVHGGGVFIVDASPSFQHCVFLENTGFLGGGAFVMADTQSRPTFVDCAFERNDTTLAGGDGGGLYTWESSSVTLIRCDFRGNTSGDNGGGVMHLLGDHLTAINCRFLGNVANGTTGPGVGGGAAVFRPAEFVNCTFVGNVADGTEDNLGGGGIYSELQSGPSSFFNCTFVANWAGQHGGGLFILHQPPVIANCIFWANIDLAGTNNNEAAQIGRFVEFGIQRPIPDHCTVQGWSGAMGGLGNIGLNPQFERGPDDGGDGWGLGGNDDFGDLRIGAGSPAIDAGNTQALPTNGADVDLAGAPRLMDDPDTPDTGVPDPGDGIVVDMGAHEYPHQCAGVACSDGNPCTVDDVCTNGRCQGVPLGQCACQSDGDCDDHIDCTLDACVGGDCLHTPNDGVCGDSLFCTGVEVCDAQIGCVSLGDPCPPGEFCNEITASCGICQSDANCDDGSDCTRDQCAGGACIFTGDPTVCPDDGLFCNGQERCDRVRGCLSAGNPCPSNTTCDEASNRCLACFTDADCDDGVDCTDDACVAGQCVTTRDDAACPDDGLFCNGAEFCDPLLGCVSVTNPCRPGFFCNEQDDTCGECAVDGDCSDGITCTVDQCVNGACRFVPDHTRCLDDGRFCTPAAFCDVVAGCVPGADPCPAGLLCDEANQRCVECFAAADCDDADPCTLEACVGGACSHTADTNCQGGVGGAARDFDGDGIVDELDRCPETPQGVPVNALGCQMSVPPPPPVAAPLPVDNARPEPADLVDRGQPPAGRSSAGSSVCGVTGMIHFLVILTCLHLMSGRVWGQPAGREARRYGLKDAFIGHPEKTGNFLEKPCKKSAPTQT